jgi:hypothetical protein
VAPAVTVAALVDAQVAATALAAHHAVANRDA